MAASTSSILKPIPAEKTRTTLICGFLGAGKTTFIRNRLQNAGPRTAVLVNEFGSLGLDGLELRQVGTIQVVELPGGCICCSQQLELEDAVRDICSRLRPERLYIEPSGVAEASAILKVLHSPALRERITLDGVITIVDAETFLDYAEPEAFGTFFVDQIASADLVLINRCDLVGRTHLSEVERKVTSLNSRALVTATSFGRLSTRLPERHHQVDDIIASTHIAWQHICLEPAAPLTLAQVEEFGAKIREGFFGRVFRAKGILPVEGGAAVQLQLVGRHLRLSESQAAAFPRLVCIGFDLRLPAFEAFFTVPVSHNIQSPQNTILPYELS